jgi:glycosyltransferase involved in cell wall biosynthesis
LHWTVLIPAYNVERYIEEALRSVFVQSHRDWDILVVDDGSTDMTARVVSALMPGRNISLLSCEHKGCAGATHEGILAARGPGITVLDGDDRLFPFALGVMNRQFEQKPQVGFGWTNFITSKGRHGWSSPLPSGYTLWEAMTKRSWWKCSHQRYFRKAVYERSHQLDPTISRAVDYQLALVMARTGCGTVYVPRITYWYRVDRPGNISGNKTKQRNDAKRAFARARQWTS